MERLIQRERLFIRLRFGALLLLLGIVALDPIHQLSFAAALPLVAAGILLNFIGWLLLRYRELALPIALLSTAADLLFLMFFIATSGGAQSPLWSLAYVLIAATALRFGIWGGLVISVLFGAIHLITGALESSDLLVGLYPPAVRALSYVLMAILIGLVVPAESAHVEQELQRHQFDIQAFAELTGTMSTNTNYRITLQQMLDMSIRGLRERGQRDGGPAGMIMLFEPGGEDALFIAAHHSLGPTDDARRLAPIDGAIKTVLRTTEPVALRDARRDPLLGQFDAVAQKFPSAVILPLRAGLNLYGVAVFVGDKQLVDTFKQRYETLEAYATQAAIAVNNAQLYAQLVAEHDRVVDSEEKVRHELARDLHDGPVNSVASLTMGIDFARTLLTEDPSSAKAELDRLHRLAAKTARDMRLTMYRLRPLALESAGLSAALEQYVARLQADYDSLQIHFNGPDPGLFESRVPSNSGTMVFDIVKEAVGNALKHAEAKNIWINLRVNADWLVASVADDGKGFDVDAVQSNYSRRGSLGMVNIQERAALARGEAQIESAPGKGTTVTVRVPLDR